jgi:hypothetical protein
MFFLCLLAFFNSSISALEVEERFDSEKAALDLGGNKKNPDITGLTIKDVVEMAKEQQSKTRAMKERRPNLYVLANGIKKVLWPIVTPSLLGVGILFSVAGCPAGINNALCITGFTCLSLPVAILPFSVVLYCYYRSVRHHCDLVAEFKEKYFQERNLEECLNQEDLNVFKDMLMGVEDAKILEKISVMQALSLVTLDKEKIFSLAQRGLLSKEVIMTVSELMLMLRMNTKKLNEELKDKRMQELFQTKPALLQALVFLLPEETKSHELIGPLLLALSSPSRLSISTEPDS